MKNFDLAIFDIDGTLLNTFDLIFGSYKHVFEKHNLPAKTEDEIKQHPHTIKMNYAKFYPNYDTQTLVKTHKDFFNNNLHMAIVFPQVKETLKTLHQNNVTITAFTNRFKPSVIQTLQQNNLLEYFSQLVTPETLVNPKPHQEGILKLLEQYNVVNDRAIMIGDTDVDILAGKNAKVATIGVTYGFHSHAIKDAKPDYIVHTFDQILPIILSA